MPFETLPSNDLTERKPAENGTLGEFPEGTQRTLIIQGLLDDPKNELDQLKKIPPVFLEMLVKRIYKGNNPEDISSTLTQIKQEREKYGNIEIFAGRNTVITGDTHDSFLTDTLKKDIGDKVRMNNGSLNEVKLSTLEEYKSADYRGREELTTQYIKNISDKIINTPPPFTFLFQGHGSGISDTGEGELWGEKGTKGYLRVSDGNMNINIHAEILAKFWKERQKKFPMKEDQPDVLILDNCYSQNVADAFSKEFGNGVGHPIILGSSRTKPAVANMRNPNRTEFMNNLAEPKGKSITISDYLDSIGYTFEETTHGRNNTLKNEKPELYNDLNELFTPPYLIVPSQTGPIQVAQNNNTTAESILQGYNLVT